MLDLFTNIASTALGYNHPRLQKAIESGHFNNAIAFRNANSVNPPKDMHTITEKLKSKISYDPEMNFIFHSCGWPMGNRKCDEGCVLVEAQIINRTGLVYTRRIRLVHLQQLTRVVRLESGFVQECFPWTWICFPLTDKHY